MQKGVDKYELRWYNPIEQLNNRSIVELKNGGA